MSIYPCKGILVVFLFSIELFRYSWERGVVQSSNPFPVSCSSLSWSAAISCTNHQIFFSLFPSSQTGQARLSPARRTVVPTCFTVLIHSRKSHPELDAPGSGVARPQSLEPQRQLDASLVSRAVSDPGKRRLPVIHSSSQFQVIQLLLAPAQAPVPRFFRLKRQKSSRLASQHDCLVAVMKLGHICEQLLSR